jgi:hypothetical protein
MKLIKRLTASVILCCLLAASALAGHTKPAGAGWCEGDCINNWCEVCKEACDVGSVQSIEAVSDAGKHTDINSPTGELDLILFAFALFMVWKLTRTV